jgi:hypothetical protein
MSGGRFDYREYVFDDIAHQIEHEIKINGKSKTPEELKEESWRDAEWYTKYPEDLNHYKYSDEVINEFAEAVAILRMAAIYTKRIDYLLSGDDGEETFLKRLYAELKEKQLII